MAPKTEVECVILRLVYYAGFGQDEVQAGYIRSDHSPTDIGSTVSLWYDEALDREQSSHPPNTKFVYIDWTILIGDKNFFVVNGLQFHNAFILLGEESFHWMFYTFTFTRTLKGQGKLMCSYCPCCMTYSYRNIVNEIKKLFKPSKMEILNTRQLDR